MAKIPRVPVENKITTLSVVKTAIKFSPSSALQCKKVQSSIEKFHRSKKLRKTGNFSFNLNIRVLFESINLFLHVFLCQSHFDNGTLHKVTHNFHLKIRKILELTTCSSVFFTFSSHTEYAKRESIVIA